MATYKVAGVGEHGKFFDGNSYQDAINYVCNPQRARESDIQLLALTRGSMLLRHKQMTMHVRLSSIMHLNMKLSMPSMTIQMRCISILL